MSRVQNSSLPDSQSPRQHHLQWNALSDMKTPPRFRNQAAKSVDTARTTRCECKAILARGALWFRSTKARVAFASLALLLSLTSCSESLAANDLFEARIRPILIEKCLDCHGAEKQEGGLRLDSAEHFAKGAEAGSLLDGPGSANGILWTALQHTSEIKMPPAGRLSDQELQWLGEWLAAGANWPANTNLKSAKLSNPEEHWAYRKPTSHPTPLNDNRDWPQTLVDSFVLERIVKVGLKPNARSSKEAWLRRISFTVRGLPPTPEEVDEFVSDLRPDAYDRVVDQLLASPSYGEKWGRHWLDVARYADTKGYVFFEEANYPWAFAYRDYVVRAFNADLPYDQFIIEQIAADKLATPDAPNDSLAAMGFLNCGQRFMGNVHDVLDDRIDVVTRGMMGLTLTCARCHDHKYDPISMADYYGLYGVFRSSQEPFVPPPLEPIANTPEGENFKSELQKRVDNLNNFIQQQRVLIESESRARAGEYLWAVFERRGQPATDDFMLITDKGALNPSMITRWESYLVDAVKRDEPLFKIWKRLINTPDAELPQAITQLRTELEASGELAGNELLRQTILEKKPETVQQICEAYGIAFAKALSAWKELEKLPEAERPQQLTEAAFEGLRQFLFDPKGPGSIPDSFGWGFLSLLPDRPTQEEYKKVLKDLETWIMTGPGAPTRAMVLEDASTLYQPVVFLRGNPNRPGPQVDRKFPGLFGDAAARPFQNGSGRLEFAQLIASPENPLTARVLVNRIWHHTFGQGIVLTTSDFGVRSEPPSHPELLDQLAIDFMKSGWSVKSLQRKLLTSTVFQQGSSTEESQFQLDPTNRLLARFPRTRLDYEAQRDSLLFCAGSLDQRLGGKGLDLHNSFSERRTLYGSVDRLNLPTVLRTFDFPEPVASSPKREPTTIAPQALYLLNNDFLFEVSNRFLDRPEFREATSINERIERTYRLLFSRKPSDAELMINRRFLLKSAGLSDSAEAELTAEKIDREAWQRWVHGMLLSNEFVFID